MVPVAGWIGSTDTSKPTERANDQPASSSAATQNLRLVVRFDLLPNRDRSRRRLNRPDHERRRVRPVRLEPRGDRFAVDRDGFAVGGGGPGSEAGRNQSVPSGGRVSEADTG